MSVVTSQPGRAAQFAADAIRRLILDGYLAPGQRLIESELKAQVPVGRSSLREAFLKLEAEGLVEIAHQRGARVRRLSRAAMMELFDLRACLEGFAAGLAAARIDAAARRTLNEARRTWRDPEVLGNALTHMENNVPLHDTIVALSGNARLAQQLAPLQIPGYRLQFLQLLDREQREISAAEHLAIIDTILAGKCARAEKLMRAHVRRAGRLAQAIPGLA